MKNEEFCEKQVQNLNQEIVITQQDRIKKKNFECPECKAYIRKDHKFCHGCGKKLNWKL